MITITAPFGKTIFVARYLYRKTTLLVVLEKRFFPEPDCDFFWCNDEKTYLKDMETILEQELTDPEAYKYKEVIIYSNLSPINAIKFEYVIVEYEERFPQLTFIFMHK